MTRTTPSMDPCAIASDGNGPSLPDSTQGDWFVLRTKSRQEKVLSKDLSAHGIGNFLPMISTERVYAGQRFLVELPLFPGYLFLRGSVDDAYYADRTRRIAQIIRVTDQKRLNGELSSLATVLSSSQRLDPFPFLKAGVRVEIRCGPLQGVRGVIEDRTRRHRVILQVDALGQAVSLEVDAAIVDLID